MDEPSITSISKRRFSVAAGVIGGLLHFGLYLVLLDLFASAYSVTFVGQGEAELTFWRIALWVWSPLFMVGGGPEEAGLASVMGLAMGWSAIVAVALGFLQPALARRIRKRLYPEGAMLRGGRRGFCARVLERLCPPQPRRRLSAAAVSIAAILILTWAAWFDDHAFRSEYRSLTLRQSLVFWPIASTVKRGELTLYEGLPHEFSKSFKSELASKKTVQINRSPFYERPLKVTPQDAEALRSLMANSDTFWSWRGPKLCGGFHPDYCLTWSDGDSSYNILICFGCHEILFCDHQIKLITDVRKEAYDQLEAILTKYRDQRPLE